MKKYSKVIWLDIKSLVKELIKAWKMVAGMMAYAVLLISCVIFVGHQSQPNELDQNIVGVGFILSLIISMVLFLVFAFLETVYVYFKSVADRAS